MEGVRAETTLVTTLGVGGDDEGGEGVSRLEPVPSILILHNVTRQEQAGHTAGHQTAPVRLLRQLSDGLLSTIFASKNSHKQRQHCGRCQRKLADQSGHRRTQCKSWKLPCFSRG